MTSFRQRGVCDYTPLFVSNMNVMETSCDIFGFQSQGMSDTTQFPLLSPLPFDFTAKDLEAWINVINTLGFGYMRILSLSSEMFWSTTIYNESFMKSFDSATDSLPKGHQMHLFRAVYCWNQETSKSVHRLRKAILAVYLRIAVYNKDIDQQLTSKMWLEYTQNRGVMNWKRSAEVWAQFPEKVELFSKVLTRSSKFVLNPSRDVSTLATECKKILPQLESNACFLSESFSTAADAQKLIVANLILDLIFLVSDINYYIMTVLGVIEGAKLSANAADFVSGIPSLVETISRVFPFELLCDVAAILPSYPLRTVLSAAAHIEQSASQTFHKALQLISSPFNRFTLIQSSLINERFIFSMNEFSPLDVTISNCEKEQREYIDHAVQSIHLKQINEIKKRVERQGLLERIGEINRLTPELRSAIDGLKDVLAHLSDEYAHLCLRHFNYEVAQATEALLVRDQRLPMDLRNLETADLRPSDIPMNLPTLSFEEEDLLKSTIMKTPISHASSEAASEKEGGGTKNAFKGLFSLAPSARKDQDSPSPSSRPSSPTETASDVVKKLQAALDRVKMRADGRDPLFEVQKGPNGERLVPMAAAKKYAGIQKFKTSAADKVAVRPTYEKFRYESEFDEEDMYEDEYDDGYELKEFRIEPLNGRLSEDEEEEPDAGAPDTSSLPKASIAPSTQMSARGGGEASRGGPHRAGGESSSRGGSNRGGRGGQSTRGGSNRGRGGHTASQPNPEATGGEQRDGKSRTDYTGGRQRQMKERHKNEFKQRGADRKQRAAGI